MAAVGNAERAAFQRWFGQLITYQLLRKSGNVDLVIGDNTAVHRPAADRAV
jgi:hypothetical protein